MILIKKILKNLLLICIIAFFFFASIPYVYTSQVLTKENMALFDDSINLFETIPSLEKITRLYMYTINNSYVLRFDQEEIEKDFSELERDRIFEITRKLEESVFFKIEQHDDFILFYTLTSPYGSRKYGACYSINSENPNDSSNRTVWQKSPYIKVKDNWYISRNLAPAIRLPLFNPDIPESSIIDHSMKTPDDNHVQSNRRPE